MDKLNIFNTNSSLNFTTLHPFDSILNKGINKKAFIHIYGEEDSGKTTLALKIIKENPDKIFIYEDVNYTLAKELPSNCSYLSINNADLVIDLLNKINSEYVDVLIIDGIGNLTYDSEQMTVIDKRYEHLNKAVGTILDKCIEKDIMLIGINSINGQNKPVGFSSQIKKQCNLNLEITNCEYLQDRLSITLKPIRNLYGSMDDLNLFIELGDKNE